MKLNDSERAAVKHVVEALRAAELQGANAMMLTESDIDDMLESVTDDLTDIDQFARSAYLNGYADALHAIMAGQRLALKDMEAGE